jgi:hypothetical protein
VRSAIVIHPILGPAQERERRSTGAAGKHQTAAPIRCEARVRAAPSGLQQPRQAAMTPVTNQVAEKKKARIAVAAGAAHQSDGLIPALARISQRG